MKAEGTIHLNKHAVGREGTLGKPYGIFGRELETGDVLEATDVYDSTSGTWEPCPCPGLTIQAARNGTVWIRPENPEDGGP